MLEDRVQRAWQERMKPGSLEAAPCFKSSGLVLGADTVLAPIDEQGRLVIDGGEARLLLLLALAYEEPVSEKALGHIRRAGEYRKLGDDALTALHLALARLPRLTDPLIAARRLIAGEELLFAGLAPAEILKALDWGEAATEAILKYSPNQSRVPGGSGRTSGQWTADGGAGPQSPSSSDQNSSFAAPEGPHSATTSVSEMNKPVAPGQASVGQSLDAAHPSSPTLAPSADDDDIRGDRRIQL